MTRHDLILRNVRPIGCDVAVDVAIRDGTIRAVGAKLAAKGPELDGGGHALIPGLIDHHIHLMATAAARTSVDLSGYVTEDAIKTALTAHAARLAPGGWVRAIGYDERAADLPDRHVLDRWLPHHLLRMQARTGALWLLNSAACATLGGPPYPAGVRIDAAGTPTGLIWREDRWLRTRLPAAPPALAGLGTVLARHGVTGVTDAGAQNGPEEAAVLAAVRASGALPQRLMLMGRADLPAHEDYIRGPLKLHFDEHDLPDIAAVAALIESARRQGRSVAAHCVTSGELLFFLAALGAAGGARSRDRIEHGSVIPASLIPDIARSGITVVSQPGFVHDRGDRYLMHVQPADLPDLYRLQSLTLAGIPLAAGSDAPYASFDPWTAIRAAQSRRSRSGRIIGAQECIAAGAALALYLGTFEAPGGPWRRIARLPCGSMPAEHRACRRTCRT
jgi:predicted amidohydrolase YtcJ